MTIRPVFDEYILRYPIQFNFNVILFIPSVDYTNIKFLLERVMQMA